MMVRMSREYTRSLVRSFSVTDISSTKSIDISHQNGRGKPEDLSITDNDLDLFETYLNSTKSPQSLQENVSSAAEGQVSKGLALPTSRDEALERIMRQEDQLNAQIQALEGEARLQTEHYGTMSKSALTEKSGNESSPAPALPSLPPHLRKKQMQAAEQEAWIQRLTGAKATESTVSAHTGVEEKASAKSQYAAPCWLFQLGKCNEGNACKFKHVRDPTFVPNPCHNYQKGRCTEGDACPYSHVLILKRCVNFANGNCKAGERREYSHDLNSIDDREEAAYSSEYEPESTKQQQHTGGISGLGFTQEQLAEAAEFAKSATGATHRPSKTRRSARRNTKNVSAKGTLQSLPNAQKVPGSAKSIPHGRPARGELRANNAVRALDPRRWTASNFDVGKLPSNFVPPHLRKLHAAKTVNGAAQTSSGTNASRCGSPLPNVADAEDDLYSLTPPRNLRVRSQAPTIASTNKYATLEMASNNITEPESDVQTAGHQQSFTRGMSRSPSKMARDEPVPPVFSQQSASQQQTFSRPELAPKMEEPVEIAERIIKENREEAKERREEEEALLEREDQDRLKARLASLEFTGNDRRQQEMSTAPSLTPSLEQMPRIDEGLQAQHTPLQTPQEPEPAGLYHKTASSMQFAERPMSIDELRSVVVNSKQRNADRRHNLLPKSLIARIERANRIIAGEEESPLSRNSLRTVRGGKDERSNGHFGGVSSRGWQRLDEMPNAAESSDSEDDSSQDAPAHNGQDEDGGDDGLEETDGDGRLPASQQIAEVPAQPDPPQTPSDEVEESSASHNSLETTKVKTRTPRAPLLSLQPGMESRPPSRSSERKAVCKQMADGLHKFMKESSRSITGSTGSYKDDLAGLEFSIGSNAEPEATQPAHKHKQLTGLKASVHAFDIQSAGSGTESRITTTSAAIPRPVTSNTTQMGNLPHTPFQYSAMQASPVAAFGPTQCSVYPNMTGTEQYRTDTIQQRPVQHVDAYGIMHYTPPITNAATNYALSNTSGHGNTYGNPYSTPMPDWDAEMFQNHVSGLYQQFPYHDYTDSTNQQFSAFHHKQVSILAAAVQTPMKPSSRSRAVAITTPAEVKYEEDYPSLPSKKSESLKPKLLPPPGLKGAHKADQNTFDALLSKGANAVGAKVEKISAELTRNQFDALLASAAGVNDQPRTSHGDTTSNSAAQASTDDSETGLKTIQKKRKQARAALTKAWEEREVIRKRLVGTYTLDGARALEYATKTYNDKRMELAGCMASRELREEDKKMVPYFSSSDLSAPKLRPVDAQRSTA